MRRFLRKSHIQRDPLPVVMTGVRLGERVLQIGDRDDRVVAAIAAKTGLTGTAVIVVADDKAAARMQRALSDAGALGDVRIAADGGLPFDAVSFDAVVVHDVEKTVGAADTVTQNRWIHECRRVLRDGGRIVTIEAGTPVGLRGIFGGKRHGEAGHADRTLAALKTGGFRSVRLLGDREGFRFVEGLKTE